MTSPELLLSPEGLKYLQKRGLSVGERDQLPSRYKVKTLRLPDAYMFWCISGKSHQARTCIYVPADPAPFRHLGMHDVIWDYETRDRPFFIY